MAALLGVLAAWPGVRADGGVNAWTSHGPEGGNVSRLAVAPGNPTRLLAGTSGGVWASSDAAATWHNCAAPADLGDVHALAFDPSNPAVAYAATSQAGIMKSHDGGDHWTSVSTVTAQAITVAPSKPTTIYAAYGWVVYRSDDGAATWRSFTSSLPTDTQAVTLAVEPDSELTVYAGTFWTGVFKSTDGGATWAAASAGLPNAGSALIGRLTFDFHEPANLLAVAVDRTTWQSGLYRSTDGGANWVAVFSYPGPTTLSALALGPANPLLIYLAAGQTLFKSSDDGATWTTSTIPSGIALAVDPDNAEVVYAGTSGGAGVLKSTDGGMTWAPSGRGLINTSVRVLALDPGPGNTLYAMGDSTELFSSQDHGGSWISLGEIPLCFFPKAIVVDPSNPNTLYIGSGGNGAFKSYDGGRSWVRIREGFSKVVVQVHSLAIDPSNPLTLYAGSTRFSDLGATWGDLLYKTTNGGRTWEVASSGLLETSSNHVITALAVDPRSPATVYAGGPGLWRSTNAGRKWAPVSYWGWPLSVSAIAIDPRNSGTVFCTSGDPVMATGGVVYKTVDGGSTWSNSSPPGGVKRLVLDPVSPETVYVGGYGGVSMSEDGGTTWTLINGGLSTSHVTALAIDSTGTRLHAATDGGGVFDLEISTATPEISISPTTVAIAAGASAVLTATIDSPRLTDTQLAASSSDPAVASVPDAVTLAAGDASVSFAVTGVSAGGPAVITVRLPDSLGGASGTVLVTVTAGTVHVPRKHLNRPGP